MRIGEEIVIQEDVEIITFINKEVVQVKRGDTGLILGNGNVKYLTGEAEGIEHFCDYEVSGVDYEGIAKRIFNKLDEKCALKIYLESGNINQKEFLYEIEEVLEELF